MSQHHFIALDVATQAARAVLELLHSASALPKGLAGQCQESAVSAPSNPLGCDAVLPLLAEALTFDLEVAA